MGIVVYNSARGNRSDQLSVKLQYTWDTAQGFGYTLHLSIPLVEQKWRVSACPHSSKDWKNKTRTRSHNQRWHAGTHLLEQWMTRAWKVWVHWLCHHRMNMLVLRVSPYQDMVKVDDRKLWWSPLRRSQGRSGLEVVWEGHMVGVWALTQEQVTQIDKHGCPFIGLAKMSCCDWSWNVCKIKAQVINIGNIETS